MAFAAESDGVELTPEALFELTQNVNDDDDFDYDFDAPFNNTFGGEAQNLNIILSEDVERTRSGCAPETVPTCDSSFPPAKVAKN